MAGSGSIGLIHSTLVLYICSRFGCKTYVTFMKTAEGNHDGISLFYLPFPTP